MTRRDVHRVMKSKKPGGEVQKKIEESQRSNKNYTNKEKRNNGLQNHN